MTKHDDELEQEIQAKGKTGPRVTPDHVDAKIKGEQYYTFPGTTFTVCLLTLENGFTVSGTSACADPANYDKELGDKIARENARDQIWKLEAYLLREQLSKEGK